MRWCISNILAANRSQKGVAEGSLTPVLFFTRARIYISNSTWSQDTPKPPHLGTPQIHPIPRPPPHLTHTTPSLIYTTTAPQAEKRRRRQRGCAAQHLFFSSLLLTYGMQYGMVSHPHHHPIHHITSPSLETTRPKGVFFSSLYYMVCDMIWYGMIWYAMYPHTHTIIPTTPPPPLHT